MIERNKIQNIYGIVNSFPFLLNVGIPIILVVSFLSHFIKNNLDTINYHVHVSIQDTKGNKIHIESYYIKVVKTYTEKILAYIRNTKITIIIIIKTLGTILVIEVNNDNYFIYFILIITTFLYY